MQPGALTALLQEVAATPEKREEQPLSLPPGTVIGRFEIIRELGRGGFGVVYEAKDRDLGRQVAVKVVRPGRITEEDGKVSREAEAIARLAHANLITLHEVGRSEHGPFLVFELLRGKTLDHRIDEGPLPVREAVHVATEVARGLAHAHAEGVIHRDLKPSNVFVTNRVQVKILDFGMAHAFGRRRLSGGTPAYMAPEQWEDAPEDERTDVFALGVMLYRMLTGAYPFPEGQGKWSSEPATVRKLDVPGSPELAELVEKMLDPIPTRRPRDGAAVLAALTPIEEKLRAKPADGTPPVHAKRRKETFGDLLAELRRRHVFRVMVGYGVFAFAVLQVTEPVLHAYDLPAWALTAVVTALAAGFPIAVLLAWAYDLTAQGVKRTPSASGAPRSRTARFLMPLSVAVAVLALAAAGGGAWYAWKRAAEQRRDPGAAGAKPSVAVLSFADLSPGNDQQYLADGVAEEVLNGLAQVDGLRVVGRSTAFSYRGKGKKVEEIGRELGVGAVLEGSVRRSGDRVRITAQLVHASDASTLWSQSFERATSDLFAVQDEIGKAVVEALAVRLLPGRSSARAGGTTNPEALQSFLRGRDLLRRGGYDLPRAWEAFEKSVATDPRFALAWVGIADAIVSLESTLGDWEGDPAARRRRAREAADRAVALAPGSPDAYRARADVHQWLESDWRGQRADLDRALALAPGDPGVALSNGFALQAIGDLEGAIAEFERVTRIDPLLERGWLNGWLGLGAAQTSRGEHAAGAASFRRALELFPSYCEPRWGLGMSFIAMGQPGEALAEAGRARKPCPGPFYALGLEALAHHDLGHPAEAQAALDQVIREYGDKGAEYQVAELHAWRGEADRAFAWLEKARAKRDTAMFWLKTDPLLRKIRGDPRWPALLERAGLPPDAAGKTAAATVTLPPTPSIAVLPFADMSPKHDQEYFADGVAEEILNRLAHVERLKVIGRTSSFSFRGKSEDLRSIGQKLGAGHLLQGSVRKAGTKVRITSTLIEAAGGTHVWSRTFDRELTDVLAVQDEIAQAVATALQASLVPSRAARSIDPEAYDLVLRGRRLVEEQTPKSITAAMKAFERAIAIAPDYAPAHAGLARAWGDAAGYVAETPDEVSADSRRELESAERAIALDPDLPDGYVVRGRHRSDYLWDWAGGLSDLERAMALKSNDRLAILGRASFLAALGRGQEAMAEARRATDVDPLAPDAWGTLAAGLLASGDLAGAEAAARRGRQVAPANPFPAFVLSQVLIEGGRATEAIPLLQGLPLPFWRLAGLSVAYHRIGKARESQAALDELVEGHARFAAYQIAQVHAVRSDPDAAFDWLEKASRQHDRGLGIVRWDPWLSPLHGDPRWKPFLRKLNLPVD